MARPTDYNEEILDKAREYLGALPKDEQIHSIEGLADYIDISRSNIYLWASQDDKTEFSDIVEKVREKQAKTLISKGLSGDFNSSITKVILTKHGYVDKQETDITTKGDKIQVSEGIKDLANALVSAQKNANGETTTTGG